MAICKIYGIECEYARDHGPNACIGYAWHPSGDAIVVRVSPCPAIDGPQPVFPPRSADERQALIADLRARGLSLRYIRRLLKGDVRVACALDLIPSLSKPPEFKKNEIVPLCRFYGIECENARERGPNACIGYAWHPSGDAIVVRVSSCPAVDSPQPVFPPRSVDEEQALIADLRARGLSLGYIRRLLKEAGSSPSERS